VTAVAGPAVPSSDRACTFEPRAGADDAAPGTPLNAGSRVHAWVRIQPGPPSGVDVQDAISVRSEVSEETTVVYAQDGLGRRQASASVDGVIAAEQSVRSADETLLKPVRATREEAPQDIDYEHACTRGAPRGATPCPWTRAWGPSEPIPPLTAGAQGWGGTSGRAPAAAGRDCPCPPAAL